jgi:hypothetical protein
MQELGTTVGMQRRIDDCSRPIRVLKPATVSEMFRMTPLGGTATRNKGTGLFPRSIDGRYAMIERHDNENLP